MKILKPFMIFLFVFSCSPEEENGVPLYKLIENENKYLNTDVITVGDIEFRQSDSAKYNLIIPPIPGLEPGEYWGYRLKISGELNEVCNNSTAVVYGRLDRDVNGTLIVVDRINTKSEACSFNSDGNKSGDEQKLR